MFATLALLAGCASDPPEDEDASTPSDGDSGADVDARAADGGSDGSADGGSDGATDAARDAQDARDGDADSASEEDIDACATFVPCGAHDGGPGDTGASESGALEGGAADSATASDTGPTQAQVCLENAAQRGEDPADPCVVCGCTNCVDELRDCYEATDVAAGGPASGVSRGALCEAVVECGRESGCTGDTCYCGTASGLACLGSANGPCKTPLERAAESTSAITILQRKTNTTYAVGRANAVSECSVQHCASQCDL